MEDRYSPCDHNDEKHGHEDGSRHKHVPNDCYMMTAQNTSAIEIIAESGYYTSDALILLSIIKFNIFF